MHRVRGEWSGDCAGDERVAGDVGVTPTIARCGEARASLKGHGLA